MSENQPVKTDTGSNPVSLTTHTIAGISAAVTVKLFEATVLRVQIIASIMPSASDDIRQT